MIHLGIDHHKKYSHAVAMNDLGTICWDGQLDSTPEAFQSLFKGTRELVVPGTPFIVAYRIKTNRLEILAVIHGACRWPDSF